METSHPVVSVVVPVFNGAGTISDTLRALGDQDFDGDIEVIVVDDGSADGTPEVVAGFPEIRLLRQENRGPAAARNAGASAARGEVLCFTDADCRPRPDWVRRLSAPLFRDGTDDIAAVCGGYGIVNPECVLARCIHREILFRHRRMPDFPRVFGSYNVAIRKDIFMRIGGFDPSYREASGEDNDLSYEILRAGRKIAFERKALVDHRHPERLGRYLREQFRHGFWRARMYLRHPRMSGGDDYTFWKDIVEVPLAFFAVPAIFGSGPVFGVVLSILLTLELFFSIRIGGPPLEILFYAGVMTLRAFSRAAGFLAGSITAASRS